MIVDLQFYSLEYLSLLTLNKQTHTTFLIQVPLRGIFNFVFNYQNKDTVTLFDIYGVTWSKPFQGISRRLAVSGARKVAAILSENNRKIRLFETEVEPEDEEDDEDDEVGIEDNMMDATSSAPVEVS